MNSGHLVVAYHGCDSSTRDALVSGRLAELDHSSNQYDWLGTGAYFFEGDPVRALLFAEAAAANPSKQYTARPIGTPAVVGALLKIGSWLDMTTQAALLEFAAAHRELSSVKALTPNSAAPGGADVDVIVRKLDKAVIDYLHTRREISEDYPYDAVRAAFPQGSPIAPSSAFNDRSHIQIALRNSACILGWFLVPGEELQSDVQAEEAKARLIAAKVAAAKKPHTRA